MTTEKLASIIKGLSDDTVICIKGTDVKKVKSARVKTRVDGKTHLILSVID